VIDVTPEKAARSRRILRNVTLVGLGLVGLTVSQMLCIPTAVLTGIWVPECPSGDMRQTIELEYEGLQREKMGTVKLRVNAHYTLDSAAEMLSTFVRLYRTDLTLVYPDGEKEVGLEVDRWNLYAGVQAGRVRLPRVPDGEYTLRARVRSAVDEQVVDVPLPLFSPSRIHVLTDRPLYEPGNDVLFRAVALRASDMRPLPFRPGKWVVSDQYGTVLMEEAVQTDEWGVAAGGFPLDRLAESGGWSVRFESGDDSQARAFTVEPFTLPRFTVEAQPEAAYYTRGDSPEVTGTVTYSSGAPVPEATLAIDWQVLGTWPAPTSWLERDLPRQGKTDADGQFSLSLPSIPADLRDTARIVGRIGAVDAAGDRVDGTVSVLLSEDRIHAEAVTEMSDGLLDGYNNRVFLRVTSPSGVPMPDTAVTVRRAWDPTDDGEQAVTDADGVAALQLDPGPPVNVVIPPLPVRPPPRKKPVTLTQAMDLLGNREASLAERLAMDTWIEQIEPCALYVSSGSNTVVLGLSVSPSGQIESVTSSSGMLDRCVADVVDGQRLPGAQQRMLKLAYRVSDPELPTLSYAISAPRGEADGLRSVLSAASLEARRCLPEDAADTDLPRAMLWSVREGSDQLQLRWNSQVRSTRLSAQTTACVERALSGSRALDDEADADSMGIARFSVSEASRLRQIRPQATVMLGYELSVSATRGDEEIGETLVRLSPSTPPPLRIRANPVIAQGGEAVTFTFIRGANYNGTLPEEVALEPQQGEPLKAAFDSKERTATFTLPEEAEGWMTLSYGGATARVFVPDPDELSLALSTQQDTYRPGDQVTIDVETSTQASVGLFGVDQTLAQLAPLPGVDDMADALILAPDALPAFAGLDSQALVMGRIQGENAAQAMVMRVNAVPTLPERDRPVSGINRLGFDPIEDLTDSFYTVLAELHTQTRAWERSAPEDEQVTNEIMAELWAKALDTCATRGDSVSDAYGRRLQLQWLPSDLLAQAAPHEVVLDGTRLPEDVENWIDWVHEEHR